ncbi:mannose-1-phosphate guanylyltransferase [Achromobacter sp. KAs 3-5]|nr:mannose-1-phosphate guanylyltransferase [Achromobacter sp. KAs 3-5]
MRAMILAAGRGERMRPLTDRLPKPMLPVGGKPLIVWHLARLAAAGIRDIVINHAWLGHEIERALGDGAAYGVRISYSAEATALETAGGIAQALPLLGDDPFLVVNGDIWCDWNPADAHHAAGLVTQGGAWLLLVDNPAHHPAGDFVLTAEGRVLAQGEPRLTFAGVGVYHPSLFADVPRGQVQDSELDAGLIRGQCHGPAESVHLFDEVALADSADGRIARHWPRGLDVCA